MNLHPFQRKSKFAMLRVNNVYTDLSAAACQLSDSTWVLPAVPVPDLGIWKEWIGSIRMERLGRANLVLFLEDLLCGSSVSGVPGIRQMSQMAFHQSKGWKRSPITTAWLEDAVSLRAGVSAIEADKTRFRRVTSGFDLGETGEIV
jgi:hypothetical protein